MELHRRKLWGDRFVWVLVGVATFFIVNQYVTRGGDARLYLLYGWAAVVAWFVFFAELRLGRRRPVPGPMAFFAGWAAYVGEEIVSEGSRERGWNGAAGGKLEFLPDGVRWTARSESSEVREVQIPWSDLHSWQVDGVIPAVWRASAYLTLVSARDTSQRREHVFHVHGLRRWRRALREAQLTGPTFARPEWLPEESAPELPLLLADRIGDGDAEPVVLGALVGADVSPPPPPRAVAAASRPADVPDPEPRPEPEREDDRPEPEREADGPEPEPEPERPRTERPEPQPTASEPTLDGRPAAVTAQPPPDETLPASGPDGEPPGGGDGWEPVIGLECHVELSTASKIFCGCPTTFGAEPNTHICPVCTGQPGSLPVINERAVEYAIRIALALNCDVAPESVFHRKNYFYPDMPKNYQISQYDRPLATNGHLEIEVDGAVRRIGIHRVHIEEDTGKTSHAGATGRIAEAEYAKVDYNRAGVPLIEIVSEADIRSPEEARAYLTELRALLQAIGVSDVRMEEGSLRVDANVSVRRTGETAFGTKAEVKNMNSIRSVARALAYEVERQVAVLSDGGRVAQETRHFDEETGRTSTMRSKEYAFDYRYFPDPDLVPLAPDPAWVQRIRDGLPELPAQRRRRFEDDLQLAPVDARTLTSTVALADDFEAAVRSYEGDARKIARWYLGELASAANERNVEPNEVGVSPEHVAELQRLVDGGTVSDSMAKGEVLRQVLETGASPREVVDRAGLEQISDTSELEAMADEVIASSAKLVEQIREGKTGAINALVGQVMGRTKGRANPQLVKELFERKLGVSA